MVISQLGMSCLILVQILVHTGLKFILIKLVLVWIRLIMFGKNKLDDEDRA